MDFTPPDTARIALGGDLGALATRDAFDALIPVITALVAKANAASLHWTDVAYASGNFTTNGGGSTWTVQNGDQIRYRFVRLGAVLILDVLVQTSTTAGGPTELRVALPSGLLADGSVGSYGTALWKTSSTQEVAGVLAVVGNGYVSVQRYDPTGGAFPNVTDDLAVGFVAIVGILPVSGN